MKKSIISYFVIIIEILLVVALIFLFNLNIKTDDWWTFISLTFIGLIIGIYVNVTLHELGHLVMGLMTGYQFVSFYIMGHLWYKDIDGKIKHLKGNQPGIAGQALMKYPHEYHDDLPYFWYNVGGIIVNIVLSIIAIIILSFNINNIINILGLGFFYLSINMVFANGIPYKDSFNDAKNILSISKSKRIKKAFYDQLILAQQLINIPVQDIQIDNYIDDDLKVGMVVSNNLINYYKALALGKRDEAYQIITTLYDNLDQIITPIHASVYSEYLTMVLLYEKNISKLTSIFSQMKKPIKNAILMIKDSPFTRGALIYYKYVKKDETKIPKTYDAGYIAIRKSYQKGLNDLLMKLLEEVVNFQIQLQEESAK